MIAGSLVVVACKGQAKQSRVPQATTQVSVVGSGSGSATGSGASAATSSATLAAPESAKVNKPSSLPLAAGETLLPGDGMATSQTKTNPLDWNVGDEMLKIGLVDRGGENIDLVVWRGSQAISLENVGYSNAHDTHYDIFAVDADIVATLESRAGTEDAGSTVYWRITWDKAGACPQ